MVRNRIKRNPRRNRALLLAILYERGAITESRGRATSILMDLMELNGATIQSQAALSGYFREFSEHIKRTVNGKRCTLIELTSMPFGYDAEVESLIPQLIWEQPEPEPPAPEIVTEIVTVAPDADDVGKAILEEVFRRYLEPTVDPDFNPQRLREAWDQRDALQRAYDRLKDDYERQTKSLDIARTKVSRLEAERVTLEANLRAALRNPIVGDQARAAIDRVMRETPKPGNGGQ